MAPLIQDFRYRPEVDGLRAVAVLAVVFYHAGFGFPGGFVGVDVFFVISGYLITSLIITDWQQGTFALAHFWERRARRIIPALVAVVLTTLVAGWFVLLPKDYAALGKSAACQSVFGVNIYFWRTNLGGYFNRTVEELPLLHTWSLAVEEQFYLIIPLVFSALVRFPALRTRRTLLTLAGFGSMASLFASLYGVAYHKVAAFYLLPPRAWELLVGVALAILPPVWAIKGRIVSEVLSYAGLAGILAPCLLYDRTTPFPGLAALPPCLGTALVVWASNQSVHPGAPTSLSKFLATRPVVFVGLISYSLYLWHWPLFAFSRYYQAWEPLTLGYGIFLIAVSFVLATLSWRFIETPFRRRRLCATRKAVCQSAAAALATSFALGVAILLLRGLPKRLPENVRPALSTNPQDDLLFARDMKPADFAAGRLAVLGIHDPNRSVRVLVWGDSHAMAALPAFDTLLKAKGLAGRAATHSATAPVLGYESYGRFGRGKEAVRFNEAVLAYIQKQRIPHVVLVAQWLGYAADDESSPEGRSDGLSGHSSSLLQPALLDTVRKLVSVGSQPWIVLQVPSQPYDVSKLFHRWQKTLPELNYINQSGFCSKPDSSNGIVGDDPAFLDQLRGAGARLIDPRPCFLNGSQDLYQIVMNGVILYRDKTHLTKLGAETVLLPVLEKSFAPFLAVSANVR